VQALRQSAGLQEGQSRVPAPRRAVVLGGSFMGMEVAMSLLALGLQVTVVEQEAVILPHLEAPLTSDFFRRHAQSRGAEFFLSDTLVAVHGKERVQAVETASGRRLPCDVLVVCIGVMPATEYLAGSGIQLEGGLVLVDELLRSNVAQVYAAGDVTCFQDPVFARRRHIEHWDNAIEQGRLAARNMLGRRVRHDAVSCFFATSATSASASWARPRAPTSASCAARLKAARVQCFIYSAMCCVPCFPWAGPPRKRAMPKT